MRRFLKCFMNLPKSLASLIVSSSMQGSVRVAVLARVILRLIAKLPKSILSQVLPSVKRRWKFFAPKIAVIWWLSQVCRRSVVCQNTCQYTRQVNQRLPSLLKGFAPICCYLSYRLKCQRYIQGIYALRLTKALNHYPLK